MGRVGENKSESNGESKGGSSYICVCVYVCGCVCVRTYVWVYGTMEATLVMLLPLHNMFVQHKMNRISQAFCTGCVHTDTHRQTHSQYQSMLYCDIPTVNTDQAVIKDWLGVANTLFQHCSSFSEIV